MGTINLIELARIFGFIAISFIIGVIWAPALTHFLYKHKLGKQIRNSEKTPIFSNLHKHKEGTPTMGGILIWGTTLILLAIFWLVSHIFPESSLTQLSFLDRGETYLPLAILFAAALVGLLDDILGIWKIGPFGGGLRMRHRILFYSFIAVLGAWWFWAKLNWDLIHIPFLGDFNINAWYIPYFIFIIIATSFSTNETDGLDGLASGILMIAFASFGIIAFAESRYDLAAFIAIIVGALLSFLWFNIPPARFFMGDTGSMSLGATLGIIAMLTNSSLILPLVGIILVLESMSVLIQVFYKKIFKKKLFLSTPMHNHFQAKGWHEAKVVMRFWVISAVFAGLGVMIRLLG